MFTTRCATSADLAAIHACWLATDYTDPVEHARMATLGVAPWLTHLVQTGSVAIAEANGDVIGFAGTQTRGTVCYLADCFVLPAWQSHGVAKTLLAAVQPPAGTIYGTLASSDPRAVSRYVRQGMTPRFPVFGMRSSNRTQALQQTLHVRVTDDVPAWMDFDRALLGYDRRVDIDHFRNEAPSLLLRVTDGAVVLGQTIATPRTYDLNPMGKWNLGPVSAISPAVSDAVLCSVVAWLLQHHATEVTLRVPGPHPAVPQLLAAGVHIQWVELFCSTALWFDPQQYAPSGLL